MSSPPLILHSDRLKASVLPEEGGRVQSLRDTHSGIEFLFQSPRPRTQNGFSPTADFQNGSCAGIEECLPSVGPCGEDTEGGPVPDHGDFWQLPWRVESTHEGEIQMQARGVSRPIAFSKHLSLRHDSLHLSYSVENVSDKPLSFLYACHPLLAIDPGDRIVLPDEIKALRLNFSRGHRLGKPGEDIPWPGESSSHARDLSHTLPISAGVGEMLYSDRLHHGQCGLYRTAARQGILVRFDPARLPYLGLWLCYGGWPESDEAPRQYAVAFEPTVAPCGTLTQAQRDGIAPTLLPHTLFRWSIEFQITPQNLSLAEFTELCRCPVGV